MRLIPSDPDIQTIVSRIDSGDILLRPNFQRGEVWSTQKKQRLIDSILRDWHIPPIHVIDNVETEMQEVLDGQQRLTAIRDFVHNEFYIDGTTEPQDGSISELDGMRYSDLNPVWKKRVNHFAIRLFRLVEYKAGEPWELFFRLNQSTRLTGAEERNAFFGPVREQIKTAVAILESSVRDEQYLGFSNTRMAYDDVLSRAALAIDRRTISEKLTASDLTELYRRESPLPPIVADRLITSVITLTSLSERKVRPPRMNKATVFTWLIFIVRASWENGGQLYNPLLNALPDFIGWLRDEQRENTGMRLDRNDRQSVHKAWLLYTLEDRSSSRVADIASVILRDAIIWRFYLEYQARSNRHTFAYQDDGKLQRLYEIVGDFSFTYNEEGMVSELLNLNWGMLP